MKVPRLFLALAALFPFVAHANDSVLVFNEINFHPATVAETEWIELRSLQGVDVDIAGWSLEGGINYKFPAGTIMPGLGYIVVAAVPGQIPGSYGPFTGALSNSGQTLRLRNLTGRIMDEVTYSDSGDWPVAADGGGVTLARRSASGAEGPAQWSASREAGGTPGLSNFSPPNSGSTRTHIIPLGVAWRYLDTGVAPANDWKQAGYDDSSWKTGATLISGGGASLAKSGPLDYPSGLLAYWSFDETSGTTAANAVAGGPAGTMVNGATFVTDATRGRVAEFDGTDDRMEVIDPGTGLPSLTFLPAVTPTSDFTWAAWVWSPVASTAVDQQGAVILGNRTDPNGLSTSPIEYLKLTPTQLQYFRNGASENLDYPDLGTSAWTHMCIVKRGLNFDYYRNGAFVVTRTIAQGQTYRMPFFVGGDRKTTAPINEHFQGRVDDVGLWTRALTASEIAGLSSGYGIAPALPAPPEQTTNATAGPEPRYFRKTFTFSGAPGRTSLELWPVADDGAVFYLNGTEIYRNNVPVTSEVTTPAFTGAPIVVPSSALLKGTNVLSAEVHQAVANPDLLFGADLLTDEQPSLPPDAAPSLVFSEISAVGDPGFFIELQNRGTGPVDTAGWVLRTSAGTSFVLPSQTVSAGGYATFTAAQLGLTPSNNLRLALYGTDGADFHDGRAITNSSRALTTAGRWGHPDAPSPGAAATTTISNAVVINEIFYHAVNDSPEEWVELYNRSGATVELGGWKLADGITYTFPAGATIAPGGYVVVAWDPAAFIALHTGVPVLGPFSGSLGNTGETITLEDANQNVVNQVTYCDGGRWSPWADAGGSSLELRNPFADNSQGEAWDSSDESGKLGWQTVTYSGPATPSVASDPATWNEFILGLLNAGEVLIDDVSVKDVTQGNVELIQNGAFNTNFSTWRIIGTQSGSLMEYPTGSGNNALKITASAETEHMHNHATTTLKNGASFHTIVSTDTYTISFKAKWLRGSNALLSRLYVDRLQQKTLLDRPATGGTPGAQNSRFVANLGPTFDALAHSPVVPAVLQAATVSVKVADPNGLASVQLFTSVNGAAFGNVAMTTSGNGVYTGTVAGQSASALVQFYIRATDSLGAVSFFPAAGPASRAMIPWQDNRAQLTLASGVKPHNLRVIMPPADATEMYKQENLMSNASIPCTVILDEREVYYRAGVALKSSEHGRFAIARVGYNLEFPPDQLFLGVHGGVAVDRSGGVTTGQKEILLKRLTILAGAGAYAPEDDLIRIIPAVAGTSSGIAFDGSGMLGAAILSKTRLKGDFLDSQFNGGSDGMMFKYERIYVLTQTINATTRVVDGAIVPENPKIPQDTTAPPGVNVVSLGANSEAYRWYWLVENNRDRDDFSGLKTMTTAIGQTGGSAAFNTQTDQVLNVSQWMRASVAPSLYGVVDNYLAAGGNGQHNALFYFPPGQKAILFAWDCDFLSQTTFNSTLINGGDLPKFLANPVYKRLFYGHMLDILNRSFNSTVMTQWATHYQKFGTDEMLSSVTSYLTPRANYARDVVNGTNGQTAPIAPIGFARTSASPTTVATPFATVTGTGWVNVDQIRLLGSAQPLAVTWLTENTWSAQVPVTSASATVYTLVAYSPTGAQLGTISVTISGSSSISAASAGKLVLSELYYNPPGSAETTEFLELLNISTSTLDLTNCHFAEELGQGINFTFASGTQVAPGGRIIVARNRAAFLAAYPSVPAAQVAAGQYDPSDLDNGGESIVLYAASGLEIFRTSYDDSLESTDGGGRSLVRVLSSNAPNDAAYEWRPSIAAGGNPGTTDALTFAAANALLDGDGDSLPAILEYALGTSDDSTTAPPWQLSQDAAGNFLFTFTRRINADDVELFIETAPEPSGIWAAANAVKLSDATNGTVRTEVWQITPTAPGEHFYARLKARLR
jgi:hypothetical protein